MKAGLTYKDAGVDTALKDGFIDRVVQMMRRTYDPRVIDHPWGFGGLFALTHYKDQIFKRSYRMPVLVACTDGVGTKLKIAGLMNKHDTVGIDLVAMSVNDLIVQGAEPLFFLDYVAIGKVARPSDGMVGTMGVLEEIIKGIIQGCLQAGCALLGGETAEMPDVYVPGEYDLAGFAVGIVEKSRIITGRLVRPGDLIIGLASSGLHSNGFSLVRKVFFQQAHLKVSDHISELGSILGEELLKPTRIYAAAVKKALNYYQRKRAIKAIVHITGGGMIENIPRVLPAGTAAEIHKGKWSIPPIFPLIQKTGDINEAEMFRVFNMGIGMVLVVDPYFANALLRRLKRSGETPYLIGIIKKGNREVIIK